MARQKGTFTARRFGKEIASIFYSWTTVIAFGTMRASTMPSDRIGSLYCLEHPSGYVKIGWSQYPDKRLRKIQARAACYWPDQEMALLTLIGTLRCKQRLEYAFHLVHASDRVPGLREWYPKASAAARWFYAQPYVPCQIQDELTYLYETDRKAYHAELDRFFGIGMCHYPDAPEECARCRKRVKAKQWRAGWAAIREHEAKERAAAEREEEEKKSARRRAR